MEHDYPHVGDQTFTWIKKDASTVIVGAARLYGYNDCILAEASVKEEITISSTAPETFAVYSKRMADGWHGMLEARLFVPYGGNTDAIQGLKIKTTLRTGPNGEPLVPRMFAEKNGGCWMQSNGLIIYVTYPNELVADPSFGPEAYYNLMAAFADHEANTDAWGVTMHVPKKK